uniref:Transposase DDE domain-containing protein n=1 Tax=mine drainage metagenome TaxID=410659 RepID=E6QV05_9ZZZZ
MDAPEIRLSVSNSEEPRRTMPKMKYQVRNWAEYDAGLRRRGSLTLWITDEAMADWQAAPRVGSRAIRIWPLKQA